MFTLTPGFTQEIIEIIVKGIRGKKDTAPFIYLFICLYGDIIQHSWQNLLD